MTELHLEETESKGRLVYAEENKPQAELTFSKAGAKLIIIDHTDVPDVYRGEGIGVKLVERMVEDVRRQGKKIIPLCPFAAVQFRRHPEWADVLQ